MSEWSELIKNFDKIREYMRDFYVYGFKRRGDYTYKSARTYDNERRRIESWLARFVRWDYSQKGKRVFLSVDSKMAAQNPLYAAWKSKSFTNGDITLHFYLLERLKSGEAAAGELTDAVSERSGVAFDPQTVRKKLKEYESLGLLTSRKEGRAVYYALNPDPIRALGAYPALTEAVRFFQETAPFGFVGATILDADRAGNDLFFVKHDFIVHTLEDGVLLKLLEAIREEREVCLENRSRRTGSVSILYGVPLRILTGAQTGRRYLCLYLPGRRRYLNVRLDSVSSVAAGERSPDFAALSQALDGNLPRCWGVSFGGRPRQGGLYLKLWIDEERERYVLDRLVREGRGGEILRVEQNVFLYSKEVFDVNETLPWVKTFIGRILSFESDSRPDAERIYSDMEELYQMYFGEEG